MRLLITNLCVFLLTVSCSLQTTKNLVSENITSKTVINSYFDDEIDYVYKAKINLKNNNFGGIVIIKKTKDKQHRVVFTTEFGNKIFDFEFLENKFKVNYIVDKLNKKIIINALKKDFQLLVNKENEVIKQFNNNGNIVYKSHLNKKNNFYFFKNNELQKIIMTSKTKAKVSINFNNIKNNLSKNIIIAHHNFNMTLNLKYIN